LNRTADNMAEEGTKKMKYNFLGKSGLKVSELCYGAMTFGGEATWLPAEQDKEVCFDLLDTFIAHGGNFIDTADMYGGGTSERVLGDYFQKSGKRNDLVVATKVFNPTGPGPNDAGLSRRHIISAIEASLERMQTSYIDLYQIHCFDNAGNIRETLTTLNDLIRCGKVHYIGCSNVTGWQLQKSIDVANSMGLDGYISLQPQYNLMSRGIELELVPVCQNEGLAVLPWSPLRGGWLAGKYKRDAGRPAEGRVAWASKVGWKETDWDSNNNEYTWSILAEAEKIAKEADRTVAQVSLRWVMQKPGITSTIIGARTKDQLLDNLGAVGWQLTDDQMSRLDKVTELPVPYPYNVIDFVNKRNGRVR